MSGDFFSGLRKGGTVPKTEGGGGFGHRDNLFSQNGKKASKN